MGLGVLHLASWPPPAPVTARTAPKRGCQNQPPTRAIRLGRRRWHIQVGASKSSWVAEPSSTQGGPRSNHQRREHRQVSGSLPHTVTTLDARDDQGSAVTGQGSQRRWRSQTRITTAFGPHVATRSLDPEAEATAWRSTVGAGLSRRGLDRISRRDDRCTRTPASGAARTSPRCGPRLAAHIRHRLRNPHRDW